MAGSTCAFMTLSFLCLMLWGIFNPLQAQDADLGLWAEVGARKKAGEQWEFSLYEQLRFKQDISQLNEFFTEAGVFFLPFKFVELGGNYRFIQSAGKEGNWKTQHHFNMDVSLKHEVQKFDLNYRLRFANYSDLLNENDFKSNYVRHRGEILLKPNVSPFTPYFSVELFHEFPERAKARFSRMRYTLGYFYTTQSKNEIGLFFRVQDRFNTENTTTEYILGINYTFVFE